VCVLGVKVELAKWVETRGPTRSIMGLGWVGLNWFYKFQYGLIFDPTHPSLLPVLFY